MAVDDTLTLTPQDPRPARRVAAGKAGEGVIESHLEVARIAGVAYVSKIPTPLQPIRTNSNGDIICRPRKKSTVDYGGLLRGGRMIALECKRVGITKHVDGSPAPCRFDLGELAPHQRKHLEEVDSMGGLAVVDVAHASLAVFVLPWPVVREAIDKGQLSIKATELEPWKLGRNEVMFSRFLVERPTTKRTLGNRCLALKRHNTRCDDIGHLMPSLTQGGDVFGQRRVNAYCDLHGLSSGLFGAMISRLPLGAVCVCCHNAEGPALRFSQALGRCYRPPPSLSQPSLSKASRYCRLTWS